MAIKIIEQRTCDWCGGSEEDVVDTIKTHRLVFDRQAREVELHHSCIEEATLTYLLDKGRKPTPEQIRAANGSPEVAIVCPYCQKPCKNYMGIAQHLAQAHKELDSDTRAAALAKVREVLVPNDRAD